MSRAIQILELLRDVLDADSEGVESPPAKVSPEIDNKIGVGQTVVDSKTPFLKYKGMFRQK